MATLPNTIKKENVKPFRPTKYTTVEESLLAHREKRCAAMRKYAKKRYYELKNKEYKTTEPTLINFENLAAELLNSIPHDKLRQIAIAVLAQINKVNIPAN
jgi:hypothetical protein